MRIDCGLVASTKVARAGLPDGFAQPGNSPSICADVRSASTLKRPSRSDDVATRPASRIGMAPEMASPTSKPRLLRAVSSSMPCRRTSASGSPRDLAVFEAHRRAGDLDVALELEALRGCVGAQHRGVDLLPHDHPIGGKIGGFDGDRVVGRSGWQVGFAAACRATPARSNCRALSKARTAVPTRRAGDPCATARPPPALALPS